MMAFNAETAKPRALLLSTDPALRAQLEHALAARGLEVRSSGDGESGLALLLDELLSLDVLVRDSQFEGCDARAFLRLIRRAGGENELPIVVAARQVDSATAARLVMEGADAAFDVDSGADDAADTIVRLAMEGRTQEPPRHELTSTWTLIASPAFAA
jgi:DNA-binding NarL/FixJ family response regulator